MTLTTIGTQQHMTSGPQRLGCIDSTLNSPQPSAQANKLRRRLLHFFSFRANMCATLNEHGPAWESQYGTVTHRGGMRREHLNAQADS